ncbi:MAG: hypothetical protein RIT27_26 [Pseudomonadota bacterium]|jgi:predicted nucleic acid-binding protein
MIYFDSCIVIYLVERHPLFASNIEEKLSFLDRETALVISPLVRLEVLVKPLRNVNNSLLLRYEQFLDILQILPIPAAIYEIALSLRVQYNLKTPDALHLATAQFHRCQQLWTNDERLAIAAKELAVNILTRH